MSQTEVRLSVSGDATANGVIKNDIDMLDRDPTHMNDFVKVAFEDVFAEPHPTVFSFDSVWGTSYKVFSGTKLWCYRITTLLVAVPAAFIWGIYFGLASCCTIWCCQPFVKAYTAPLRCIKNFLVVVLDSCYRPCYETCGYIFYNIRVKALKGEYREEV